MKTPRPRLGAGAALVPPSWPPAARRSRAKLGVPGRQQVYKEENYKQGHRAVREARWSRSPTWPRPTSTWAARTRRSTGRARTTPENKRGWRRRSSTTRRSSRSTRRDTESLKKVKMNTLGALTGIYSEPPAPELRDGDRLRPGAGEGQPERPQEPLRASPTSTRSSARCGSGEHVREGGGAEPQRRQGLRRAGRLLQQAPLGGPDAVRPGHRDPAALH